MKEGKKSLTLFVGAGRGGLSPVQRAEVLAFAQNWKRDATGGITIDRPVSGANERAANDTLKEALSIIVQAGVPNNGIGIRPYHPGANHGALRLNYPLMVADAGPCGLWPDDLGASNDPKHYQNQQYYNFGCATQRNLAAMVAEPADIVQPRAEGPPTTPSVPMVSTSGARARARQPPIPMPPRVRSATWQNDQNLPQTVAAEPAPVEAAPRDEHIAPAPRVSIQAFCETVRNRSRNPVGRRRSAPRQGACQNPDGRRHGRDRGFRGSPTPNVIMLESDGRGDGILTGLDALAEFCDAGTRVMVIGRTNDVTLFRELVRRGVSD